MHFEPGAIFVQRAVTLWDGKGFTGNSFTIGIGQRRLFGLEDFNDAASSIQVPAGLVAVMYQHADDFGPYGLYVDLLEDTPDLSIYGLDKQISYVTVFETSNPQGYVWARAIGSGTSFVSGHWERARANGQLPPNPGVGAVGPPLPSQAPPPTTVVQVTGSTFAIQVLGPQSPIQAQQWDHAINDQFGVLGSDYRGAEEIGSAAFERASNNPIIPDFINFWYPQIQPRDHRGRYFKRTLIGTVDHAEIAALDGTYEDHDFNILVTPNDAHRYLIDEGHPRTYTDIMSTEWNATFHQHGQASCDDVNSVRDFTFVDVEILPSSDVHAGVSEGLRDRIEAVPSRTIGVYGPWIYDKGHCCHSEIHPSEEVWWRDLGSGGSATYSFNVFCDASKRFWWRDQMDDGTKLKPWGAPPITGVFAIAFEVNQPSPIVPVRPLEFRVTEIDSLNVARKTTGSPVTELTYLGATLARFIPANDLFSASFEQIGTGPDGRIRGFLVLETTVGLLTQKLVNDTYPAGVDVNAIPQDDERKVYEKEEGRHLFQVHQAFSGGVVFPTVQPQSTS